MPHVFGWQHIVYLIVFLGACGGSIAAIKLKVKTDKTIDLIFKILGGVLLALLIWNRIAIAFHRHTAWGLVPDSFCGVGSLALSICLLVCKRDALPFHCLIYLSFWGGLLATFYPNFVGQASYFMYPATISGLLHHGVAMYAAVLLVICGYVKPSLKKFYAFPVGLCFIMCYGLFLIDGLGFESAMYIAEPLVAGTPLTWYFVAVLLIAGNLGFVWLYEYLTKRKRQPVPDADLS